MVASEKCGMNKKFPKEATTSFGTHFIKQEDETVITNRDSARILPVRQNS